LLFLARIIRGFFATGGTPLVPRILTTKGDPAAMTNRTITVAAAQLGPIQRAEPRSVAVERMIRLLERAHHRGVELVVFPELALTTFFPPHYQGNVSEAHHLRVFHSHLTIQAGCYQNACFAVAAAKAGIEDGRELFGHSIIVNPRGEIIAMATTWADELITADLNLDHCTRGRTTIFAFEKHRRPEAWQRITSQVGAVDPPVWQRTAR
jgi:predicted amidohydrolase